MLRPAALLFGAVLAALAVAAAAQAQPPPIPPQQLPASPAVSFDMVVLDRDGRVPESLKQGDVTVSVDGKPRRVAAVRRVSRGPGAATDAASRQARAAGVMAFAAEPVRNILLVVDQAGLVRGDERAAVTAGRALLDRLGMADRLAVVLLPFPADQMLSLATEQPVAREMLGKAAGRIDPAALTRGMDTAFPPVANPIVSDPERLREAEPVPAAPPPPTMRETEAPPRSGTLADLAGLVDALGTVPGRKVVVLVSAGLTEPAPAQLSDVAAAAIASRTTIHVFAMPGPRDETGAAPQLGPLEALARSTGGSFLSIGRNPERAVTRTVAEIASCYVVELEPAPADSDGKRRSLRVEVAGRGLTVRAPSWLLPSADPGDLPAEAAAPAPTPESGGEHPAAPSTAAASTLRPPEVPSAREAELQLAMARLVDYVEAYERQYSGLVAEEEYRQSSRGTNSRIRSDYLLVKPDKATEWVSFRDVFEVDGVVVRDRDDRLRRLFLEPGVHVGTQLQAIRDESARYNVGIVERNINVPLFMLRFLQAENRPRFRFRLAGKRNVAGVEAWRVEFEERVFPTIITDILGRDVDSKGWFLVDEVTGAIVETCLKIEEHGSTGEIVVSFRHDPALGMWVPARMHETYRTMTQRSLAGVPRLEPIVEGTAIYANYRRFQVKVEERVVIPK
jgi:VWFA-related protein